MAGNIGGEETDLDKIAEDELARLQRQYRIMEMERTTTCSAVRPKLRKQRQLLEQLNKEYEQIMLDLKLTKSTANLKKDICIGNEMSDLLLEQEQHVKDIAMERFQIGEMEYLMKQLEKEVMSLKGQQVSEKEAMARVAQNHQRVSQLENRLEVATKRFNSVNTINFKMRQDIDHLLQERANFNIVWSKTLNSLAYGKNLMMELVEQSTLLYDQREEWCHKLQGIKDKAQADQVEHKQEMGELQRQLDYDSKLHQFLAVKGSVRVMAELEAKEAARKRAQRDQDAATQERYKDILRQIQEYAGENDFERLIAQFCKQDEENYALFNYVNEVNHELETLATSVGDLKIGIADMRAEQAEREATQQETLETLTAQLKQEVLRAQDIQNTTELQRSRRTAFMVAIQQLFQMMDCQAAPILQLLGANTEVNIHNVMLFLKTIERRTLDVVNCAYYAERVKKIEENRNKAKIVTTLQAPIKVKMIGKEQKKAKTRSGPADKSTKA